MEMHILQGFYSVKGAEYLSVQPDVRHARVKILVITEEFVKKKTQETAMYASAHLASVEKLVIR